MGWPTKGKPYSPWPRILFITFIVYHMTKSGGTGLSHAHLLLDSRLIYFQIAFTTKNTYILDLISLFSREKVWDNAVL